MQLPIKARFERSYFMSMGVRYCRLTLYLPADSDYKLVGLLVAMRKTYLLKQPLTSSWGELSKADDDNRYRYAQHTFIKNGAEGWEQLKSETEEEITDIIETIKQVLVDNALEAKLIPRDETSDVEFIADVDIDATPKRSCWRTMR